MPHARPRPAALPLDTGMVSRRLVVPAGKVVEVKALVEAWEGAAAVFSVHGGDLVLASPPDRARELDELVGIITHALGAGSPQSDVTGRDRT